ncbi:MAG: hypothetical protein ACLR43_00730 [Faecalibacillus faecis]
MIVIIDYNVGNLKSVVGAFKELDLKLLFLEMKKLLKKLRELFYLE